ncbi:MAG TPA: GNAT family N-acetyltransferase [Steroidobacteraceae bacterium]|nr:GNAT family N-acetyltransferase [Steroidobacteraceae bacterium]HQR49408.1 GNAT family N-acetyltransferase [Steroidobacteraceae bacterium]
MNFQPFDLAQQPDLMRWFPDAVSVRTWGGPGFRHPFDERTFREDAKFDRLSSWALVATEGSLAAFGQYYLKLGRCHLARLAVSPSLRGRGVGRRLVHELGRVGAAALGASAYSLFVYEGNATALRLYRSLGFAEAPYPERSPEHDGILFMVATTIR